MFSGVADTVKNVDTAFVMIFGIATFFLIFNTIIMLYFCWRYSRKRNPVATNIEGHVGLETFWTVIPTLIVLGMFYFGMGFQKDNEVPDDAFVIKVTARMWSWTFEYPNGKMVSSAANEHLMLPVGRAIKLEMTAEKNDVLHSFYIPAFRIKRDVVPAQETMLWFEPKVTGEYQVYCAEYCGLSHSKMMAMIEVVSESSFKEWYGDDKPVQLAGPEKGEQLVKVKGCVACHTTDGSRLVGPSFKDLYGRKGTILDSKSGEKKEYVADEEYIHTSIVKPNDEVVDGYPNAMTVVAVTEEEITQIIDYLKSISSN